MQRSGREKGRVGRAGETQKGEGRGGGEEHTVVRKGEGPPKLTSGGRHHPAHLFGLSVLRWVAVGRQSGGGGAGGRGPIFLESFVCRGVHTRAACVCVCVCVCVCKFRRKCAGTMCVQGMSVCVACVCLCHCVSRVINTAVGAVTMAEKMRKFPQAESGMGEGNTLGLNQLGLTREPCPSQLFSGPVSSWMQVARAHTCACMCAHTHTP